MKNTPDIGDGFRSDLGTAGALIHDAEIGALFTLNAEIEAMLEAERALAHAQAATGETSAGALAAITGACRTEALDKVALLAGTRQDGVVVPQLVRQVRAACGAPYAEDFHKGTTSQDIFDTALMLRLKCVIAILHDRLRALLRSLERFGQRHGSLKIMARTRSQDALPFTLGDKVDTWRAPLLALETTVPTVFPLQLGGPVGLRATALGANGDRIAERMAERLGLACPDISWHTDRKAVLDLVHWAVGLASGLGKLGADVMVLAQTSIAELNPAGGRSSAMPHKNNPVQAELLVTLARYVAGHRSMMDNAGPHENERSGVAWTMEWLALPPVFMGCGAATLTALDLIEGLEPGPSAR